MPSAERSYRRSRSVSPEFARKKSRSRSRSQDHHPRHRGDRRSKSRSRSATRRNDKRSRSRSWSRRRHSSRRSRSPLRGQAGYDVNDRRRRSRSNSTEAPRKQPKKEKKAKKDKKKHKRHKTEDDDAVTPGSALAQHDDSISDRHRRQATSSESPPFSAQPKDPAVSLTASNNVMSFFAQLKQQEAGKEAVGTLHASGVKAPVSTGISEGWECAKPGCGHRNSKYAGSCNKCGAMKRMSEWR